VWVVARKPTSLLKYFSIIVNTLIFDVQDIESRTLVRSATIYANNLSYQSPVSLSNVLNLTTYTFWIVSPGYETVPNKSLTALMIGNTLNNGTLQYLTSVVKTLVKNAELILKAFFTLKNKIDCRLVDKLQWS